MIPPIVRRLFGMRTPDAFARADDRDWRKLIPQEVNRVPAGATGRRRAARSWFSGSAVALLLVGMGALLWLALDETPSRPASASLRMRTDGWLSPAAVKLLAFPADAPATRDVAAIRLSLEADPQVLGARVRRLSDGTLDIELRERLAVARLEAPNVPGAAPLVRLLGADGVPFAGAGYPAQAVRNLPLVTDLPPESQGGGDAAPASSFSPLSSARPAPAMVSSTPNGSPSPCATASTVGRTSLDRPSVSCCVPPLSLPTDPHSRRLSSPTPSGAASSACSLACVSTSCCAVLV